MATSDKVTQGALGHDTRQPSPNSSPRRHRGSIRGTSRLPSTWLYYRDIDPKLGSIRDEPEFKVVFADIERDMARQRAEIAARPKDAPLPVGGAGS